MRLTKSSFPLTVKNIQKEIGDYISIFFHKPANFVFQPGDCFDLIFQHPDFQEGRIFSFSSSPTEDDLRITFRKGITEYKKRLEDTKNGDTFLLHFFGSQYSFFTDRPLIFYAGGIGIAVFRSFIKMIFDQNTESSIQLIYINRTELFPFQNELTEWEKLGLVDNHYLITQKKGRLTPDKLNTFIPNITHRKFEHYIAGPPLMVDATTELLEGIGIPSQSIHTDSFDGYLEENR